MKQALIGLMLVLAASMPAIAAELPADAALSHVGETTTVCGSVASARNAPELRGRPMFLYLGKDSPKAFTIVLLRDSRPEFVRLKSLVGRQICASGRITLFMGRPQVVLETPFQFGQSSLASARAGQVASAVAPQ